MAQARASDAPTGNATVAQIRPHETPKAASEADKYKTLSGFEGREDELGRSMSILLKMLGNHAGYQHEMNDPLVKAHLLAIRQEQGRMARIRRARHPDDGADPPLHEEPHR